MKQNARAKFDETVEMSMNLGIDPRHADQMVRGLISLPNGTGKTLRIGVFARGAKAEEAQAAGADVVGAEDLAEKVQAGEIDFDRCIATPDMMALVGRLGKILGPRGLMPNPRLGTVTMDVKGAIPAAKAGQVEFRAEKAGIVHAGIGKASFPVEKAGREREGFCRRDRQGEAGGRQGHLCPEGGGEFHHGAWGSGGRGDVARPAEDDLRRPLPGEGEEYAAGRGREPPNLSETARDACSPGSKGLRPARGRRGCQGIGVAPIPGGSGYGLAARAAGSAWTGEPGSHRAPARRPCGPEGNPAGCGPHAPGQTGDGFWTVRRSASSSLRWRPSSRRRPWSWSPSRRG